MLEVLRQDFIRHRPAAKGVSERQGDLGPCAEGGDGPRSFPSSACRRASCCRGQVYIGDGLPVARRGAECSSPAILHNPDILLVAGRKCVVIVAACYVLFNLAVDIAQSLLDPRVEDMSVRRDTARCLRRPPSRRGQFLKLPSCATASRRRAELFSRFRRPDGARGPHPAAAGPVFAQDTDAEIPLRPFSEGHLLGRPTISGATFSRGSSGATRLSLVVGLVASLGAALLRLPDRDRRGGVLRQRAHRQPPF